MADPENSYTTLDRMKAYMIPSAGADAGDDALIEDLIEQASRAIDTFTGTWFYGKTATRYYRVGIDTQGRVLTLDAPLLAITSITNADGNTISTGSTITQPLNDPPFYALVLSASSGLAWQFSNDCDTDQIALEGSWGHLTATEDTAIELACQIIVQDAYLKRSRPESEADRVTGAGVVLRAGRFPQRALALLAPYRRQSS